MAALQRLALRGTPKATKAAARYTPAGGAERCGMCRHYVPSSSCARIEGPVSAAGWCQLYSQQVTWRPRAGQDAGLNPGLVPPGATLDLSFFGPTLDPSLTFTRASTGTYFDATGTMQTVSGNTPRFDYDPVTHAALGLLIEEQRTNTVTNSGTLTDCGPSLCSKTAAATVAPDGTTTGVRFTEDSTATAEHYCDFSFTPVANTTYTGTVFIKAGTHTAAGVQFRVGGNFTTGNGQVSVNLTTGAIISSTGVVSSSIANAGNGWYRVSITSTAIAAPSGTSPFRLSLTDNTGAFTYSGNGTGTVHFWGAQLEAAAFPTSYIPTTAAAVTRRAEACTRVDAVLFGGTTARSIAADGYALQNTVPGTNAMWLGVNDGSTTNQMTMVNPAASSAIRYTVSVAGTQIFSLGDTTTGVRPTLFKTALTNATTWSAAMNGVLNGLSGGVSTMLGPLTTLNIGTGGTTSINGYIRRVRYWPRVLSNTELQQVTL